MWENQHQSHLSKSNVYFCCYISSGQIVRINPSCHTRTMDHIITADDSEEIEIHSKWLDWTWTLGQPESEMVTTAIDKLCTKVSGKFDTEILLHELDTMTKEVKEIPVNHLTFTTQGAMIGGAIICLFLLFCCWR